MLPTYRQSRNRPVSHPQVCSANGLADRRNRMASSRRSSVNGSVVILISYPCRSRRVAPMGPSHLDGELRVALDEYLVCLDRQPLAERARDAYQARVESLLEWLSGTESPSEALSEFTVETSEALPLSDDLVPVLHVRDVMLTELRPSTRTTTSIWRQMSGGSTRRRRSHSSILVLQFEPAAARSSAMSRRAPTPNRAKPADTRVLLRRRGRVHTTRAVSMPDAGLAVGGGRAS